MSECVFTPGQRWAGPLPPGRSLSANHKSIGLVIKRGSEVDQKKIIRELLFLLFVFVFGTLPK